MIKLYVDATKSQIECIASGETKMICAELASVIQRMYAGLHQNNPAAAELFKRCIVIAATDPGCTDVGQDAGGRDLSVEEGGTS